MTTLATTPELDDEIQTIIATETEPTALVLQGVVSLEKIPTGDLVAYRRIVSAGTDAATNIKRFEALFEPVCSKRHARWKAATEARARLIEPLNEIKKKASYLIGAYDREAERLRREEEARLQEEERKRAETQAAEDRKLAEAEAKRLSEENAINDAIALEAEGDKAGAAAVLAHPTPVPVYVPPVHVAPVILQKTTPKVAGKSGSTVWSWRVKRSPECHAPDPHNTTECSTCCEAIPAMYKIADEKTIGQIVRALKDKTNIAGIEVFDIAGARFKG